MTDHKIPWEQRFDEQFPKGDCKAPDCDVIDKPVLSNELKSFISDLLEEAINELETNPHPGTEFKNLQYWIEAKQIQLKDKYGIK